MSSNTLPAEALRPVVRADELPSLWQTCRSILMPLASLRLTVTLFALAIALVFFGTLAQVNRDIWEVVHGYFRCFFAWVEFQIFFPPSFFPSKPQVGGGFWFPGGWTIGGLMGINLLAAHAVRFTVQARGQQLVAGLIALALGILATWLVIASGNNKDGLIEGAWVSWGALWVMFQALLGALLLASVYGIVNLPRDRRLERWLLAGTALVLGGTLGYFLSQGKAGQLDDSAMRILWQLVKGTVSGLVLLAGCWLLFNKRAGIVLLHGGIALMMFNELFVGLTNVEGNMVIFEGETVNFVRDVRTVELAVVDRSPADQDVQTIVPYSKLAASLASGEPISHELLPFQIKVVKYYTNSELADPSPKLANPATDGVGLHVVAVEARPSAGTDTNSEVDHPAAYVELSASGKSLGTRLLAAQFDTGNVPDTVTVDGKKYDLYLRFKRSYKPYEITLLDVRKEDYLGTATPRNYQSDIRLVDRSRDVERDKVSIWMNNPLRFAGETFYQSNWGMRMRDVVDPDTGRRSIDPETGKVKQKPVEVTTLQVVSNTGWMIPYVGCMIVAVGMLAQFVLTLMRFLKRQDAAGAAVPVEPAFGDAPSSGKSRKAGRRAERLALEPPAASNGLLATVLPLVVVALSALYVGSKASVPRAKTGAMDVAAFGRLPVVDQGRVKPFDTLARNSLQFVAGKQTFRDAQGNPQPAIKWLLDVISDPRKATKHRVFLIRNLEVLELLGLEPRKGFTYAASEFMRNREALIDEVAKAAKTDESKRDARQRELLALDRRMQMVLKLQAAFDQEPLPRIPSDEEFKKNPEQARRQAQLAMAEMLALLDEVPKRLAKAQVPLAVPLTRDNSQENQPRGGWEAYATAYLRARILMSTRGDPPGKAVTALNSIFIHHALGEADKFNESVKEYEKLLADAPPPDVNPARLRFEAFFNHFEPFYYAAILSLIAFVLATAAWLGWTVPLNRAAFWLMAFTLAVHTFGLVARIYISGRPPVTTLYSSAVFIGWGAVVFGLVLEAIFRIGIGNVIASVSGFATLLIAHMLAGEGDTFTVLQAVLDTQFWLATHVTCITLGYATTYVAGLLGLIYILRGLFSTALTKELGRELGRMIYGVLCFAIFFSFVGTVLGGLWADDSWGRFWGWDPKENGALIIVLWNALVLHARWGGMIKDRGLAILAIGGNIVTSWSWFGVNQLGVGLHSYGFTNGVIAALAIFAASQLAIIAAGCLPTSLWRSFQNRQTPA